MISHRQLVRIPEHRYRRASGPVVDMLVCESMNCRFNPPSEPNNIDMLSDWAMDRSLNGQVKGPGMLLEFGASSVSCTSLQAIN